MAVRRKSGRIFERPVSDARLTARATVRSAM